jgi:hypothetical protein
MCEAGAQFRTEAGPAAGTLLAPPDGTHKPFGRTAHAVARNADCQVGRLSALRTPDRFGNLRYVRLGVLWSDLELECSPAFFWRLFSLGGSLIVNR